MPNACYDWLKFFLDKMSMYYTENDRAKERIASDTIQWSMKNVYPQMMLSFSKELCSLFETYWTHDNKNSESFFYGHLSDDYLFGLNRTAEHYESEFRNVFSNPFLINLFRLKFWEGFDWAISFVNRLISKFAENKPDCITSIEIYFAESKQTRTYWGHPNMWLISIDEYKMPTLISDIIYLLNRMIINNISAHLHDDNLGKTFAKWIKDKLYSDANNIAFLTIIENVGMHFQRELPGYALDLASSLYLLKYDIPRYTSLVPDPTRNLLEKQMMRTMGIPSLDHRYKRDEACKCLLRDYVIDLQLHTDTLLRQRCHDMLDYLYAKVESDQLGGDQLLQVQRMDARDAVCEILDEKHIVFSPRISGEAARYVEEKAETGDNSSSLVNRLHDCFKNVMNDNINSSDVMALVDETLLAMEQDTTRLVCENPLMMLVAIVLKKLVITAATRTQLCNLWIDGIRRILSNGTFAVETSLNKVLFEQINTEIYANTKDSLKLLILDLLLYRGHNGLISEIANLAKEFLANNEKIARSILNTIVMLAKDEMDHQKYNADYLDKKPNHSNIEFIPNVTRKLSEVDRLIIEEGNGQAYISQRDAIIAKYLYAESELEIEQFDMTNYDISIMSRISSCGLKLSNVFFRELIKKIMLYLVECWHLNYQNRRRYDRHDVLDSFSEFELAEMFRKEVVYSSHNATCAIDILFDKMDFSLFTEDTISFYLKIFGHFLPVYLDAWQNPTQRNAYKSTIKYLEGKVNKIQVDRVRIELYKSLFLCDPGSFMIDFSKCLTEYSYGDISFLNEQFSKYGKYHLKEMLCTIHQLRIDKLLPHILLSVSSCFTELRTDSSRFPRIIKDGQTIVQSIIYKAFIVHSAAIKQDYELTAAYENILETLVGLNYEDAAVLLDEFRLH